MYKFGQIKVTSNQFYNVYQIASDINLEKIRVSQGVVANKHDIKYIIGYEIEPGNIVPLYIKTPKNCISSGVTQNEASPLKMGFNVSEDADWVKHLKDTSFQDYKGDQRLIMFLINGEMILYSSIRLVLILQCFVVPLALGLL